MDSKNWSTNFGSACLYCSMRCLTVAFKRNGLEETPNNTLVKRMFITFGLGLLTSSTHKKRRASLSDSRISSIRNACSMSPIRATRWHRKRISISSIFCTNAGPVYRKSFKDGPSSFAELS